jgi:hypothetical protein
MPSYANVEQTKDAETRKKKGKELTKRMCQRPTMKNTLDGKHVTET